MSDDDDLVAADSPHGTAEATGMLDGLVERRAVATNGVELSVLEAGPPDGPLVVLCHGFPELAHSWRHQLEFLSAAGFHVIAPDQRGYGESSRPEGVDDYDVVALTGDIAGLLDEFGAEQAVVVGHDWGANVAWTFALLHPERTPGVAALSVPFLARSEHPPIATLKFLFDGKFFYMLYFQEPGVADAELGADTRTTLLRMFGGMSVGRSGFSGALDDDGRGVLDRLQAVDEPPAWMPADDFEQYVAAFERTGFTGGLNWYRNLDRNWERTAQLTGAKVTCPSMFLAGSADPVISIWPVAGMEEHLADHRGSIILDDAGHWVQQERPEEVNEALLAFLRSIPDD